MTPAVPNRQIAEEAADWAVRLDAGRLDARQRRDLAQWLAASPAHVDELLYAAGILGGMAHVDSGRAIDIDDLLAAHAPEVIALFDQAAGRSAPQAGPIPAAAPPDRAGFGRRRPWMAIAAVLLLAVMTGAVLGYARWTTWGGSAAVAYETATGEQRSIALEDGSIVHMNTGSSVRVTLSGRERRIDLIGGEALFEVAHDARRPFRVYAGESVTQAVGTVFNVRQTGEGVQVVVVEGKVLVRSHAAESSFARPGAAQGPDAGGGELLVPAGHRADVGPNFAMPTLSAADVDEVTLWRARQLSFENETLAQIALEFNRYNRMQMIIADRRLGNARFSGEFKSNDPESFLAFLALTPGVEIDRSDSSRAVITLRPQ